jgi:serine/threonine protein kinase
MQVTIVAMSNYIDPFIVQEEFTRSDRLGSGSDGDVDLYTHPTQPTIAVKHPKARQPGEGADNVEARKFQLDRELTILKTVKRHPNIVELLGWDDYWFPGPALFFEYCPLGDTWYYFHSLKGTLKYAPEMTLWKLMADISKALNYLHNGFNSPLIHGDLKCDNILVQMPDGHTFNEDQLVLLPTFKLADFSRSTIYKAGYGGRNTYQGTWAYAPPLDEQRQDITPASDIWSLGATVQFFAYGKDPVASLETFGRILLAEGYKIEDLPDGRCPKEDEDKWNRKWPVVYRPLTKANPPYSAALDKWYSMCMCVDMDKRATAADLVEWFVPVAERKIKYLIAKWLAREGRSASILLPSLFYSAPASPSSKPHVLRVINH